MANKDLAIRYKRQYATNIDADYEFTTDERNGYLSNPLRYAGQVVYDSTEDKLYRLNSARTAWTSLGGGHKIVDSAGTEQTDRAKLKFVGATITDNGTDTTTVTINTGVSSVNGSTGVVTLTADSFSDASTTNKWWTNARTIASALTGYVKSATNTAILATDTILQAIQKLEKKADDNATNISGLVNSIQVSLKCSPEFQESEEVCIIGKVTAVGTENRTASDASAVPTDSFTYSYRVSTSSTFTTGQTFAQLSTQLVTTDTSRIIFIKSTNIVSTVNTTSVFTISKT